MNRRVRQNCQLQTARLRRVQGVRLGDLCFLPLLVAIIHFFSLLPPACGAASPNAATSSKSSAGPSKAQAKTSKKPAGLSVPAPKPVAPASRPAAKGPTPVRPPLGFRFITCILATDSGHTWVGAEEAGLGQITDDKSLTIKWQKEFSRKSVSALAEDWKDQLWVGTRRDGLWRLMDGKWQRFGVLEGLGGTRVCDLAVDLSGEVLWCATENGVSSYDGASWKQFTHLDGLPPGEIAALALDADQQVWAAGACGGIAKFTEQQWKSVPAKGSVLDKILVNDLLISSDGMLWLATTDGIYCSPKTGSEWIHIRPHLLSPARVLEDYVTCIGEDSRSRLCFGTRKSGALVLNRASRPPSQTPAARKGRKLTATLQNPKAWSIVLRGKGLLPDTYVSAILPCFHTSESKQSSAASPNTKTEDPKARAVSAGASRASPVRARLSDDKQPALLLATYGYGLCRLPLTSVRPLPVKVKPPTSKADSDSGVPIPAVRTLALSSAPTPVTMPGDAVEYLGADWQTQGNWIGRYGKDAYVLGAMGAPHDVRGGPALREIDCKVRMGDNHKEGDSLRHWIHWRKTYNRRCLQYPAGSFRRQASWDDAGELYPPDHDGPHLFLDMTLPAGQFMVSLYFVNIDCIQCPAAWRTSDNFRYPNRFRDYVVEVFPSQAVTQTKGSADTSPAAGQLSTPFARTRIYDFHTGMYARFRLEGERSYTVRIARNASHNTMVSGVFVDALPGSKPMRHVAQTVAELPLLDAAHWQSITSQLRSSSPKLSSVSRSSLDTATSLDSLGYSGAAEEVLVSLSNTWKAVTEVKTEHAKRLGEVRNFTVEAWREQYLPQHDGARRWRWEPAPLARALVKSCLSLHEKQDARALVSFARACNQSRQDAALEHAVWQRVAALGGGRYIKPEDQMRWGECALRLHRPGQALQLFQRVAARATFGPLKAKALQQVAFVQHSLLSKPEAARKTVAQLEATAPKRWVTKQARKMLSAERPRDLE